MRQSTLVIAISSVLLAACKDGSASESPTSETSADTTADSGETSDTTGEAACPGTSPSDLVACVERERYLADLEFIAQPREPGSDHWQAVQDLCFDRLGEYGYEVDRHSYPSGVNVVARKLGTETPEQQIVLAAHYDHILGCNGADDNASGTAAVLEAARVLATREFPRTLIVACWDEEELGLIGAEAYVDLATSQGDQILFNYNFEMIGYYDDAPDSQTVPDGLDFLFPDQTATLAANEYRGDFIAIIVDDAGVPHTDAFSSHAQSLGLATLRLPVPGDLKNSPLLSDLRRSDHAAFWAADIPAVMITDTSEFRYANYHCASGEDAVELLDHDFATKVVAATVGSVAESLGG